jgi:hypothetical protein
MTRVINGTIFVSYFSPTANPGEYTFTGATYDNQADGTGNGAYDVQIGYLVYIQATDINTATPVPGVVHRYRLTSITVVDSVTFDGTILWDENREVSEVDTPTNGSYCNICEPTTLDDLGAVAAVGVYYNLSAGADIGAYVADFRNKLDKDSLKNFTNIEGGTITQGQVVFESSEGNVELARADDPLKPGTVIGLVYDASIDDGVIGKVIIKPGYRMGGYTGLTVGVQCVVSRTTAGDITQSLTGWVSGEHVFYVGEAISSTEIIFNPKYEVEY